MVWPVNVGSSVGGPASRERQVVMLDTVMRSGEMIARVPPFSVIGRYSPSLMDSLFPSINTAQRLAVSLFFVGLLVAFGRLTFYLPDNPAPITFQTTGVLLMGGVLGLRWGLVAIIVYYLLGMAGVPVFKDGGNGWHYISGTVTAGYIIGFIAAVPVVGFLSQHGWDRGRVLWPMLVGNLVIYFPALLWLHFFDFGFIRINFISQLANFCKLCLGLSNFAIIIHEEFVNLFLR